MAIEHWKEIAKAVLLGHAIIGFAWWFESTSPLGWWNLKPRTKEEKEMAHLYERRVFPYPGDKEAVKDFLEKGGAFGTTIGQKGEEEMLLKMQNEKFGKEAQKLWLRMRHEAIRDFQGQGLDVE